MKKAKRRKKRRCKVKMEGKKNVGTVERAMRVWKWGGKEGACFVVFLLPRTQFCYRGYRHIFPRQRKETDEKKICIHAIERRNEGMSEGWKG